MRAKTATEMARDATALVDKKCREIEATRMALSDDDDLPCAMAWSDDEGDKKMDRDLVLFVWRLVWTVLAVLAVIELWRIAGDLGAIQHVLDGSTYNGVLHMMVN